MRSFMKSHAGPAAFLAGVSMLSHIGCNVAVNPFEFHDAALACTVGPGGDCPAGDEPELDAGNSRPCTTALDCVPGDLCRAHLCVPATSDGGLDAGADPADAGTPDAGCDGWMSAVPPVVDFGVVTQWCNSRDITVALRNDGCAALMIFNVSIEPPSNSPMLIVSAPGMPFPLEPGLDALRVFILRYVPTQPAAKESSTLVVETAGRSLFVPIEGTATTVSAVEDTFVQGAPPAASFHLSRWADPATMGVEVDGVTVAGGGDDGWSYDGGKNDLVFGANAVPQAGAGISVRYEAICF